MKKIVWLLLFPALVLAGCDKKPGSGEVSGTVVDSISMPGKKYLTEQQLQEQVNREIRDALDLANDERITDAIEIIRLTEEAINHVLDSNYVEAITNLEAAIGKAAVMTAARPDLQLFPLDVQVTVRDLIADPDMLGDIRKEADRLTDKGYLQEARHLLQDLASEIQISKPMLPVATYPDALSEAARALSNGEHEEALLILHMALGTVFVETVYVPLPLIRAERMLAEVSALLEQEETVDDMHTLLDNAEYQIRFAEALGYGKHDREFGELYEAIGDLRKEMKKEGEGDSANLTSKLREKLKAFKTRISSEKEGGN
ncbi:MAG TPA: YfdX family protein [Bacteroides sp.]|nr:YfdX family protein [Bacteroides sp.]